VERGGPFSGVGWMNQHHQFSWVRANKRLASICKRCAARFSRSNSTAGTVGLLRGRTGLTWLPLIAGSSAVFTRRSSISATIRFVKRSCKPHGNSVRGPSGLRAEHYGNASCSPISASHRIQPAWAFSAQQHYQKYFSTTRGGPEVPSITSVATRIWMLFLSQLPGACASIEAM
jgi:hypothetical protein